MFCPDCGAEFRDGIEQCFDCEIALVPEPPPEPKVPKYVTVLETSDSSVIPVLRTALESAGIPYRTLNEGLTNLAQGMLVRVPEDRAEEARQLMSTPASSEEDGDAATT